MNIYYIYAYIRQSDGTPYYIGKGKGDRAYKPHKGISVPTDKSKIVILESNLTEVGALALERRLIRWWGRKDTNSGILLNRTDGGDGVSGIKRTLSPEHKQKLLLANLGKKHSAERRLKNSQVHMGIKPSNETREKLSAAAKGRKHSDEAKQKIQASSKARRHSEETRQKIREAALARISQ